ncbi:MAG: HIT domain-containing protein [Nanoarchaeota archaeon]|nr:HIT domain-containing protein [Nanoarchaeota archaeon]
MMKENCIFCKIIKKEIPSKIIFEDDICLAILDINPATTGHILLMPKEHYMIMPMVPDEVLGHLNVISKSICILLKETFTAKGITTFVANGAAAGQQSQHYMMHIIPRYDDDGINFNLTGTNLKKDELIKLSNKIKEKLTTSN